MSDNAIAQGHYTTPRAKIHVWNNRWRPTAARKYLSFSGVHYHLLGGTLSSGIHSSIYHNQHRVVCWEILVQLPNMLSSIPRKRNCFSTCYIPDTINCVQSALIASENLEMLWYVRAFAFVQAQAAEYTTHENALMQNKLVEYRNSCHERWIRTRRKRGLEIYNTIIRFGHSQSSKHTPEPRKQRHEC